ncbi:hypothetical protein WAI453_000547 [Rhynchosporium graminicola]
MRRKPVRVHTGRAIILVTSLSDQDRSLRALHDYKLFWIPTTPDMVGASLPTVHTHGALLEQ